MNNVTRGSHCADIPKKNRKESDGWYRPVERSGVNRLGRAAHEKRSNYRLSPEFANNIINYPGNW
jgi:hypothetical protein